ncbi:MULTISPECIES: thermonuclease family protein [unclassified Lysinibacillus]|uniref:thermonuclease family protein n=1 Tax=unclassified Lysinibacillus TaxID=2636778 RepID=UPI0031193B71
MKKVFFLLLLSTLLISACTEETTIRNDNQNQIVSEASKEAGSKHNIKSFEEFPLEGVIDGDTLKIQYNGSTEKVRLLLVDTPETNHPSLGEQPFGQEAKEFTKQLLKDKKTVYLEFDVSYRDKYKRLLAYVYTDEGINIQEELLKNGLARVAYIYEPNTKHVDWFETVQRTAQQQAIGIWSVENYVTDRGFRKEVFNSKDENKNNNYNNKSQCNIKGNINAKGAKIYHLPGQQNYEDVKAEELFCSVVEAENVGFKAAER